MKITLIGYPNDNFNKSETYAVHTRTVYIRDALTERYGKNSVSCIGWNIARNSQEQSELAIADIIIAVAPASAMLRLQALLEREDLVRKLIILPMSGSLPEIIGIHPELLPQIQKTRAVLEECELMRMRLASKGISNSGTLYNFRKWDQEYAPTHKQSLRKCILYGRVITAKGVAEAIESVRGLPMTLDIAGPLVEPYLLRGIVEDSGAQMPNHAFPPHMHDQYNAKEQTAPPDNVRYIGEIPWQNPLPSLGEYDAMLFPSYYPFEGCSGALYEALAAGLPIIATNWRYNAEFVRDGKNGFLVPIRDSNAITQKLQTLINDPSLLTVMGERSHKLYTHIFAADKCTPTLFGAIENS
jgi:glycosyltransferase involved in cell wall biosynthesis